MESKHTPKKTTLSAGPASGQQEVGHEGVATGRGGFSLCSFPLLPGLSDSRYSRWSLRIFLR
ncbi:hypothetical protein D1864_04245 [Oceanobacillus picturae]|nr:hypothetical protein D1864_04245 [Oceanobacillus picturae]